MATNGTDQLLDRIKAGDTLAFEQLVNEYKGLVFSLVLQMVKERQAAEEVAQDVFIKVFKSIQGFKGDSKFSTWLYRVTRNCCLDHLRAKKIKYKEVEIEEFSMTRLDSATNALEMMINEERNERLRRCLSYLSAEDAAILTLFYFEERNLNEVADVLETSINSAKVRLHRARKRLASVLIKQLEPEMLKNYG